MKFSQLALISNQDADNQIASQVEQRLELCNSSRRLVQISQTSTIANSQIQLHAA